MKKISLLIISLLLILLLNQNTFAGCFVREDIDFEVISNNKCMEVEVIKTCQQYLLKIKSNCNNIYVLVDEEGNTREIRRYHQTNHRLTTKNIEKGFIVYDYVEYDIGLWEKKLSNINNKIDIIDINGKTFSIYNKIKNIVFYKNEIILTTTIILMAILILLIRKKNKLKLKKE